MSKPVEIITRYERGRGTEYSLDGGKTYITKAEFEAKSTKSQTDNTELDEIKKTVWECIRYNKFNLSDTEAVGVIMQAVEAKLQQQDITSRIDELLGADDEVRLHNTVGESYQDWFTERLAKLIKEQSVTEQTNKKCDLLYCCSGLKPLGHNEPVATAGAVQTRQTTTSELGELPRAVQNGMSQEEHDTWMFLSDKKALDEPYTFAVKQSDLTKFLQGYILKSKVIEAINHIENPYFVESNEQLTDIQRVLKASAHAFDQAILEIRQTLNLEPKENINE